ncbi:MAG: FAD-linked oxidase C-terminal domain-containing protein [Candidatus Zixiibacteriota bacterium]
MSTARLTAADELYQELAAIVGLENVHIEGGCYDDCSHDATDVIRPPLAAVTITSADVVPQVLRAAAKRRIPVIARGAGTGYTGGATPEYGGIVLAFIGFNRILEINTNRKIAIVEPGIITQVLADAAAAKGLFYPPDPASVKESSIGGNVAECAGGLRCKKYGLTKDYILGIEGYDIDGSLVQTGCFANSETYDLGSILIGSEGTLVVIAKIALQLIDPPASRRTFFATFANQSDAADVVAGIMAAGVIPAVLEFMDGDAIDCTLEYLKWTDVIPAAAALVIELDGEPAAVARETAAIVPIIKSHTPTQFEETADDVRRDYLWTLRRSISRAITAAAKLRVSEDVCVPPSKLPRLVESLPALAKKYSLRVNSFGHAGDGNLHVNFLATDDTPEIQERIHAAVVELFKITVAFDGTISGEHGIGTTKKDYLPIEVAPETLALFRKIKSAFDPPNLVNPGKIF